MKHISVMLKPASGMCDMRCTYCFYADLTRIRSVPSYGMMSIETAHLIINNVLADLSEGDRANFAFQGGEPTLAGVDFFEDFFSYAEDSGKELGAAVEFALQTNGLSLREDWCKLLKKYPVLVGLSVDGDLSLHDGYRKDAHGMGTYKRIMQSKKLLDKYQIQYNVLTVLTNQSARHPQKLWKFLINENIQYVQNIPCLDELDNDGKSNYSLQPERFYRFYSTIFSLWKDELKRGRYISVKLFDDLFNYYGKGIPTACGINGSCSVQFVCESDGSVFPCDFYMLDEYKMGSLTHSRQSELFDFGAPFILQGKGTRTRNHANPVSTAIAAVADANV